MTAQRGPRSEVSVGGAAWPINGAQVAIVRDGAVLVQFRLWPPGWELPGGHCDEGEDPVACAAREAAEETGLEVRIGGLVGVYSWSGLRRASDAVYWGEASGSPQRSIEAMRTRFVGAGQLPATVFPWIPQRVADAVAVAAGAPPVHRVQPVTIRQVLFFGGRWADALLGSLRRRRRRRL